MSNRASLKDYSPYFLLYGRRQMLGMSVLQRLVRAPPLDLDSENAYGYGQLTYRSALRHGTFCFYTGRKVWTIKAGEDVS